MCGSGTFLLEAAQMASNTAPGLDRRFAFEKLLHFDQVTWAQLCSKSRAAQRPIPPETLFGFDHDQQAVNAANINVTAAGFGDTVTIGQADILDVQPPHPHGLLITNPPYGVRSGEDTKLSTWYPQLGDALKRHFVGWRAFFFTADLRLAKLIRLTAARRTPLFNGALECRLFEYPIVEGSHRTQSKVKTLSS